MNHFRISNLAEKDLEDIWVYLAQQNEILADQKIAEILDFVIVFYLYRAIN